MNPYLIGTLYRILMERVQGSNPFPQKFLAPIESPLKILSSVGYKLDQRIWNLPIFELTFRCSEEPSVTFREVKFIILEKLLISTVFSRITHILLRMSLFY